MLAAKLTTDAQRVIYFDPMQDYSRYAGAREVTVSQLLEKPELLESPTFRFAVVPNEETIADELEETIMLARGCSNLVLVMDEVGDYRQKAEHVMNKLARNGRHDGIVPIYVSQVAVDIPLTVRRLATRVYSFLQIDKRDLDALSAQYGQDFAQSVSQSKTHEDLSVWILPTLQLGRNGSAPKSKSAPQSQSDSLS